jgi:hypothetical protein
LEFKLVFHKQPGTGVVGSSREDFFILDVDGGESQPLKKYYAEKCWRKAKCIIAIATYCTLFTLSISFLPLGYAAVQV